jgi:hypothetical protein
VDRYAKALAGYAQAQPDEDGALRLVAYLRERAHDNAGQARFAYMDGPQGEPGRAGMHAAQDVRLVRVAASATASARAAAAASPAAASGPTKTKASAPASAAAASSPAAASNDVPGLLYQSFLESNDLANAQRVATEQVAKNPGSPVWTKRLAQVAEWNHASPLALQMWLAYAQATHDPDGWKNVMRLAPMLNDDNAYLAALIQASNAAPADLKLLDAVIAAYERLGRPDDALAFLRSRQRTSSAEAIDWATTAS